MTVNHIKSNSDGIGLDKEGAGKGIGNKKRRNIQENDNSFKDTGIWRKYHIS